jgi:hypothetical protein
VSKQGSSLEDLFKGRQFEGEIIILCVRWYLQYKLSNRDLAAMVAERGVFLAPSTILRWVQYYAPEFEKRWTLPGWPVHHGASTRCASRFVAGGCTSIPP